MKYMGVDYGTKRVGLALSDDEGRMAFPHMVLDNDMHLLEHIKKKCGEEGVGMIVVGESRDFSGTENAIMEDVHRFRTKLEQETGLPVKYEPEVLTTQEARRAPGKKEKSRKPQQHEPLDAKAAAVILQAFIDKNDK